MSLTYNKQEIIDATDQCVMCGLCLPHCPTYTLAKSEPESPRGRIALVRALYEGDLTVSNSISSHLDHCLTCMNCERVCPANVDYEKIIDAGRAISGKQTNLTKRFQQSVILFALANNSARNFFKTCISVFRTLGLHRLFSGIRLFSLLPVSNKPVANKRVAKISTSKTDGPKVAILNTCAGDLINDETNAAAKLILSKLGCNTLEQKQTYCCGALHQHTGDLKTASNLRKNLIHSVLLQKPDYLVSLATGCGAQIKRYSKLNDDSAKQLSAKLNDVNDFVLQQLKEVTLNFKPLSKKVYLHQPCSHYQIANDITVVEQLLKLIPEVEVVTFEDQLACCGAGGMNTITQDKTAGELIENKIHELKNSSADYLVSSNIGCALHFQAHLKRENSHAQVCHPITLLAQQVI